MVKDRIKRLLVFMLILCILLSIVPSNIFAQMWSVDIDGNYFYTDKAKIIGNPSGGDFTFDFKIRLETKLGEYEEFKGQDNLTGRLNNNKYVLNTVIKGSGRSLDSYGCYNESCSYCTNSTVFSGNDLLNLVCAIKSLDYGNNYVLNMEDRVSTNSHYTFVITIPYYDMEVQNNTAYNTIYNEILDYAEYTKNDTNYTFTSVEDIPKFPLYHSNAKYSSSNKFECSDSNNIFTLSHRVAWENWNYDNTLRCCHNELYMSIDKNIIVDTFFNKYLDTTNLYISEIDYNETDDGEFDNFGVYGGDDLKLPSDCGIRVNNFNVEYKHTPYYYSSVDDLKSDVPDNSYILSWGGMTPLKITLDIDMSNSNYILPLHDVDYIASDGYIYTSCLKLREFIDNDGVGRLKFVLSLRKHVNEGGILNTDYSMYTFNNVSNDNYLKSGDILNKDTRYLINNVIDDNGTKHILNRENAHLKVYVDDTLTDSFIGISYRHYGVQYYTYKQNIDYKVESIRFYPSDNRLYLISESNWNKVHFKNYFTNENISSVSLDNIIVPSGFSYWLDKNGTIVDLDTINNTTIGGTIYYGIPTTIETNCKLLESGDIAGTVTSTIAKNTLKKDDSNKFISVEYTTPDMTTASVGGTVYKVCFDSSGNIVTVTNVKYNDYLVVSNNESLISCIDKDCNTRVAEDTIPSWNTLESAYNYKHNYYITDHATKFRLDLSKLTHGGYEDREFKISDCGSTSSYDVIDLTFDKRDDTYTSFYIQNTSGDKCQIWHDNTTHVIYVKDFSNDITYSTKDDITEFLGNKFNFVDIDFDSMMVTVDFTPFNKLHITTNTDGITKNYISLLGKAGSTLGAPIRGLGHLFDGVNKTDITSSIHNQTELDAMIDGAENKSELVGISYNNVLKVEKELCQRDSSKCITPRPYKLHLITEDLTGTGKIAFFNYYTKKKISNSDLDNIQIPDEYTYWLDSSNNIVSTDYILNHANDGDRFYGIPSKIDIPCKLLSTGDIVGHVESIIDTNTLDSTDGVFNFVKYTTPDMTNPIIDGVSYNFCFDKFSNRVSVIQLLYNDYLIVSDLDNLESCVSTSINTPIAADTFFAWSNCEQLKNYIEQKNIQNSGANTLFNSMKKIKINMGKLRYSNSSAYTNYASFRYNSSDILSLTNVKGGYYKKIEIVNPLSGKSMDISLGWNVIYAEFDGSSYSGDSLNSLLEREFPFVSVEGYNILIIDLSEYEGYFFNGSLENLACLGDAFQFYSLAGSNLGFATHEIGHDFSHLEWQSIEIPSDEVELRNLIRKAENSSDFRIINISKITAIKKAECLRNSTLCTNPKAYKLQIETTESITFKDYFTGDIIGTSSLRNVVLPDNYSYWTKSNKKLVDENYIKYNAFDGDVFYGIPTTIETNCKLLESGNIIGTVTSTISKNTLKKDDNDKVISVKYTTPDMSITPINGVIYHTTMDINGNRFIVKNLDYNDYICVTNDDSMEFCVSNRINKKIGPDTIWAYTSTKDVYDYLSDNPSKNNINELSKYIKSIQIKLSDLTYSSSSDYKSISSYCYDGSSGTFKEFCVLDIGEGTYNRIRLQNPKTKKWLRIDYNTDDGLYATYSGDNYTHKYKPFNTTYNLNTLLNNEFPSYLSYSAYGTTNVTITINFSNIISNYYFRNYNYNSINNSIKFNSLSGSDSVSVYFDGINHKFNDVYTDVTGVIDTQTKLDSLIANSTNKEIYEGTNINNVVSIKKYTCIRQSSVCTNPKGYKLDIELGESKVIIRNYFDRSDKTVFNITEEHPRILLSEIPNKYHSFYTKDLMEIDPTQIDATDVVTIYGIPKESTVTFKSGVDGSVLDTQKVDLVSVEKVGNELDVKYEPISDLTTREFNGKSYKYWTEKKELLDIDEDWTYYDNTIHTKYNQELYYLGKEIDETGCEMMGNIVYSAPYLETTRLANITDDYYFNGSVIAFSTKPLSSATESSPVNPNETIYIKMPQFRTYEEVANFDGFRFVAAEGPSGEGSIPPGTVLFGLATKFDNITNKFKIVYTSLYDGDWDLNNPTIRIPYTCELTFEEYRDFIKTHEYAKVLDRQLYPNTLYIVVTTYNYYDYKEGYYYTAIQNDAYSKNTSTLVNNNTLFWKNSLGEYESLSELDTTEYAKEGYNFKQFSYIGGRTFPQFLNVKSSNFYFKLPSLSIIDTTKDFGMQILNATNSELESKNIEYSFPKVLVGYSASKPTEPFYLNINDEGYVYYDTYDDIISALDAKGLLVRKGNNVYIKLSVESTTPYMGKKYRCGTFINTMQLNGNSYLSQVVPSGYTWYERVAIPTIVEENTTLGHDFTSQIYTTVPKPTEQSELNALALGAKNYDTSWDLDLSKIKEVKKQLCARADDICTTPHAYNLQIVYYGVNPPIVENSNTNTNVVSGDTIEGDLPLKIYDEDKDLLKVTIDDIDYTPDENNEVIETIEADNKEHTIYAKDETGHEVTVKVKVNMPNSPTIVKTDGSIIGTTVIGNLEIKASDIDKDLVKVTVDGVDYVPDTNNEVIQTIEADDQMHTIKAVDEVGHETIITVTINTIALSQNAPDVIDKSTGLAVSNNGIYVGDLQIKVTDIDMDLAEVTVDGISIPIDPVSNSAEKTIVANNLVHEIIAKDAQGNTTTLTVIVKTLDSFNITVRGFLKSIDNTPIANAKIQLHSTPRTVTTDENGYYEFDDVELDNHTLKASVGIDEVYSMSLNLTKTQVKAQVNNISNTFTLTSSSEINNDSIVLTVNAKECDNHIHTHKTGDELSATCTTSGYVTEIDYCPTCLMEWSRITTVKPALGHIWVDDWVKLDTVTNDIILGAENSIAWNGIDAVYRRYCNRARDAYELKTVSSTPLPTPTPTPTPTPIPTPTPEPTPTPTPTPTPIIKYTVTVVDKYGDADAVERCKDSYDKGANYRYSAIEKDGYVVYGNRIQEGIVNEDITLTFIYKKDIDEGNTEDIDTPSIDEDIEEIETPPSLNKVMIKVYDKYDGIKSLRKIYKVDFNTKYSYKAKPRNNYKVVGDSVISGIADEEVIEIVFEYEPISKLEIDEDTNIDDIKDEDIIDEEVYEETDDGKSKTGDNGIKVLLLGIILMMLSRRLRRKK